ncbi:translational GTPase TypA [Candidatus Falkowbacteria bacterium]|uniref:50S ribosomal subunit assembly factor BipA n=1 Tax=Candidatus Falkowbacteria bacterium CG10_big_fil_rev_8_21_14_0_10_37_18 TaxID=1974562 RepID=A0A2H0V974_9BACT|nr:translational GTPase TypA [Candidatus Falkowbacteria bacterium]NCQ12656.1 translational GTPase TypA [Candidatus Falkowbacteria bacterium]OIO06244.1 MAG: GTP-binding protein TypA [Candidatus Falkowbacteria bacterium CG1_02_37_21]PIR95654.1 MAG: translational GTPase TypA [Candidatus Falkowbacteria bacterium CG10_big_fil_rev_8_21_14_0_10_37_18]
MEIRNIAIIAHVDHGKTTLTDALMRQTGMTDSDISMDSNDLEKERGITIYSKNTSVFYRDTKINIVDTPGHADFSSEVERILRSIDCVLLLVDAQEGPMPQTKFVLKKSLELGLKPIVVINKIDKPAARPEEVGEMVYELFLDLGASDEQLDFPVIYAISKQGIAKKNLTDESTNLDPLLDLILEHVAVASNPELETKQLLAQPFNLAYDNFLGRLAICRIYEGKIKAGQNIFIENLKGDTRSGKTNKLFTFSGVSRKEVTEAVAGDIVMVAGLPDIYIGETIAAAVNQEPLPAIKIDEPTISLGFLVNNSPFAGKEGKFVTNRQIKERLEKELEVNVGLKIDFSDMNFYRVYGRGELHIAILLENLRRENYELQVSQPQAIIKEENGQKLEPFEEITVDIPEAMAGVIIEKISKRKGRMTDLKTHNGQSRLLFEIPTRGLLGYRNEFVVDTRGEGILCAHFLGFKPYAGTIEKNKLGSMVSMVTGKSLAFSLWNLQDRGELYISPNTTVYEGMVIGNSAKGNDLVVNPIKGKQLSNVRASGTDEAIILIPPLELTLERALSIMNEDEYLEITPQNIRLRKQFLTENERVRAKR